MTQWRPPRSPQERNTRAIRSMSNGSLDGRVVGASPVRKTAAGAGDDSNDADISTVVDTDVTDEPDDIVVPPIEFPPVIIYDGLAPAASPVPVLRQFAVGGLAWNITPLPNADPQTYQVYAGLPGFTPDPSNLIYTGPSTEGRFDRIGDTLLMPAVVNPDDALTAIPSYVVRVLASDHDGPAVAGISAESNEAQPRRADNYDISALYGYFGKIEVSQLEAGTMNASIVLAAEILTAASGARAGISNTDGFVAWGPPTTESPDGEKILSIPIYPDDNGKIAAFLKAQLEANGLQVNDFLALRGVNNEFSKGSVTALATGTTSPSSPPQVSLGWDLKPRAFGDGLTLNPQGWATGTTSTDYWVASNFFGGYITQFVESTGSYDQQADYDLGSNIRPTGCTVIDDIVYVLCRDENRAINGFGKYYVRKYNRNTGAYISEWQWQPSGSTFGVYSKWNAAIGRDGNELLIVQCANAGDTDPRIFRYDTSGNFQSFVQTNLNTEDHMTSVNIGTFDLGTTVTFLTRLNGANAYAFVGGTYDSTRSFPLPVPSANSGIVWADGIFKTLSTNGVYLHSKHQWTSSTQDRWWVAHTWFDRDTTTVPLSNQHETLLSKKVSFSMKKRSTITITTGALPAATGGTDDVTGIRVYFGKGATEPTATAMKRAITEVPDGRTSSKYSEVLDLSTAFDPDIPEDFPVSTPAVLRSAKGGFEAWGDGTGKAPGWVMATRTKRGQNATASMANGTTTIIAGLQSIETDAAWSYDSGTFTCLIPGVFNIVGQIEFATAASGVRRTYLYKAGTTIGIGSAPGITTTYVQAVAMGERFAVNETLTMRGYQNSGGSLSTGGDFQTYIAISRISA